MVDCSAYCWWPVRSDGYVCGRAHIAATKWILWEEITVIMSYWNWGYIPVLYILYLAGGFKYVLLFIPTWGNDPIWRAYFSNGLVQPPTRYTLPKTNIAPENGGFQKEVPFPGVYVQVAMLVLGRVDIVYQRLYLHPPSTSAHHQPTKTRPSGSAPRGRTSEKNWCGSWMWCMVGIPSVKLT